MAFSTKSIYGHGAHHMFKTKKMMLQITHVPTGQTVEFPAFIEMLSDAFNSNWTGEDVYGRMDPIATYQNTRRAISVAWNVPADSYEHAQENITKANKIFSFLYPLYDDKDVAGATAINQGPLWRVRFGNLIRDSKTGKGLLGYVNGLTFDPTFENGMFYGSPTKAATKGQAFVQGINNMSMEYLPKTFRLNFEFTVLHEHSLGWRKQKASDGGTTKYLFRNDLSPEQNAQNFPWGTTGNEKLNKDLHAEASFNRASQVLGTIPNQIVESLRLPSPSLGTSIGGPPTPSLLKPQLSDPGGPLMSMNPSNLFSEE
jgi:hypothetical protein